MLPAFHRQVGLGQDLGQPLGAQGLEHGADAGGEVGDPDLEGIQRVEALQPGGAPAVDAGGADGVLGAGSPHQVGESLCAGAGHQGADPQPLQGGLVHLGHLHLEQHLLGRVDRDVVHHLGGVGLGDLLGPLAGLLVGHSAGEKHRVLQVVHLNRVLGGVLLELGLDEGRVPHHLDVEEGRLVAPLFPDHQVGDADLLAVDQELLALQGVRHGYDLGVGDGDQAGRIVQGQKHALVGDHRHGDGQGDAGGQNKEKDNLKRQQRYPEMFKFHWLPRSMKFICQPLTRRIPWSTFRYL